MRERTGECLLMAGKRKDGSSVCKGVRPRSRVPLTEPVQFFLPPMGARGEVEEEGVLIPLAPPARVFLWPTCWVLPVSSQGL